MEILDHCLRFLSMTIARMKDRNSNLKAQDKHYMLITVELNSL